MMRPVRLAAVCLWLGLALPSPAEAASAFRFSKGVEFKALDREEIVTVQLDSDVYAATRDGFPDLRIVDEEDREVPFVLQKARQTRTQKTRQTWQAENVSLKPLEEGGLEIHVRLDARDPQPQAVRLDTPLRDYERQVRIFGSLDGRTWAPLVSDAVIFDYSRYMDVGNCEVPLAENRFRHFRILIDDVTAEQQSQLLELTRRLRGGEEAERIERTTIRRRPFRIDRIELSRDVTRERVEGGRRIDYAICEVRVEEDAERQTTLVEILARREPLAALVLKTASRNFSRRATAQVPETRGVRTEWRTIGEATISRIDFRDLKREQLRITFPEQRRRQYRIVVHNGDSPPLEVTGVRAEGNVYRLVFLAAPEKAYRVCYGSETAKPPSYDTAAVLASLKEGYQPVGAELGGEIANPDVPPPPAVTARDLLNNPLILGGLVAVLVVILAWSLYRAVRRVEQLPKE